MIPIAPDGTVQMGVPILTSEDAGVGTLFESLLWCILLGDEGFSVWSGVYIRCTVCTMVFIQCKDSPSGCCVVGLVLSLCTHHSGFVD